jgi:hypothetical protein
VSPLLRRFCFCGDSHVTIFALPQKDTFDALSVATTKRLDAALQPRCHRPIAEKQTRQGCYGLRKAIPARHPKNLFA